MHGTFHCWVQVVHHISENFWLPIKKWLVMFRSQRGCHSGILLPVFLGTLPYPENFFSIVNIEELLHSMNRRSEQDTSMYLRLLQLPPGTGLHDEDLSTRYTEFVYHPFPSLLLSKWNWRRPTPKCFEVVDSGCVTTGCGGPTQLCWRTDGTGLEERNAALPPWDLSITILQTYANVPDLKSSIWNMSKSVEHHFSRARLFFCCHRDFLPHTASGNSSCPGWAMSPIPISTLLSLRMSFGKWLDTRYGIYGQKCQTIWLHLSSHS